MNHEHLELCAQKRERTAGPRGVVKFAAMAVGICIATALAGCSSTAPTTRYPCTKCLSLWPPAVRNP